MLSLMKAPNGQILTMMDTATTRCLLSKEMLVLTPMELVPKIGLVAPTAMVTGIQTMVTYFPPIQISGLMLTLMVTAITTIMMFNNLLNCILIKEVMPSQ